MRKFIAMMLLVLTPGVAWGQYTDQDYNNFIQRSMIEDDNMHHEQMILEMQSRQMRIQEELANVRQRMDDDQLNRTIDEYQAERDPTRYFKE